MFIPVTTTLDGAVQAKRGLEMMGRQARDMSVPLKETGESLIGAVTAQFMSEGSWSGTPWAPLTEEYAMWKDAHAPGLPMLVGLQAIGQKGTRHDPVIGKGYAPSGRMRRNVLNPAALHVRPTMMWWEPIDSIAGWHQRGTDRMVARPMVVLTPQLLHEWDRVWVRWLNSLGSLLSG